MNSTAGYSNRCNGMTMSVGHSYSPFPSNGHVSAGMDVGYDDPIHSQQRQLPTKLQCSLLVKHNIETKMHFNQLQREHQTKILEIVSSILHIAAAKRIHSHSQLVEEPKPTENTPAIPLCRISKVRKVPVADVLKSIS